MSSTEDPPTLPAGLALDPGTRGGSLSTIGAAIWAGLAVGLVEVGFFVTRVQVAQSGLFRKSPHVLWMAPVADASLFGVCGLALAVLVRPIPRVGRRMSSLSLCTLAVLAPMLAIPGLRAAAGLALALGLACWIEPAIRSRADRARRLARRTAPALGLAVLSLAAVASLRSWPSATAAAVPAVGPNVLLVVLDTVRADATGLNGPGRDATPNLSALARRGARFDRAIATAPWTLPSHASIFTGRSARELGVGPDRPLDDRDPTLAEYLGRRGYDTAGFVANTAFCSVEYGLARGFVHYEDYAFSTVDLLRSSALGWLICQRIGEALDLACEASGREASHPLEGLSFRKDAERINRDALRWIAQRRDRPFFAFLNYFDAHDPYLLPEGAGRRSGRGPTTLDERRVLRAWIAEGPRDHPHGHFALAREAYDDCLAYLDDRLGRLVDRLDRIGALENTVVIVTADHGEHFGEHRRQGLPQVGHRLSVHQAEVHVPLLIVAPGRVAPGGVVTGAVSLKDLPATVVDLVGLDDGSPFPGRSLLGSPGGAPVGAALVEFNPDLDQPVGLRYQVGASGLIRAIVSVDASLHRHGDGREQWYDLRADPGELHDLSATDVSVALRDRLRAAMDDPSPRKGRRPVQADPRAPTDVRGPSTPQRPPVVGSNGTMGRPR